jgi:hypothetical protein
MNIKSLRAEKNPNTGKNEILLNVNEDDVIILNQGIRLILELGKFDKDDPDYKVKFNHVKEEIHNAFKLVRPS